jgi:hypothetical protein
MLLAHIEKLAGHLDTSDGVVQAIIATARMRDIVEDMGSGLPKVGDIGIEEL